MVGRGAGRLCSCGCSLFTLVITLTDGDLVITQVPMFLETHLF